MSFTSLEDKIQQSGGNPLSFLRNSPDQAQGGQLAGAQLTNWRDEQLAWRHTSAFFDLSHHMTDLTLQGPDAVRVLSELGVNSVANLAVGRAKQFVATNEDGFVIGDSILDVLATDTVRLSGSEPVPNWIQYHLETGDYDVTFDRDAPTAINPAGHPAIYRYQLQGPTSLDIIEQAVGGPVTPIGFFRTGELTIAGRRVRAIGHGMSRADGMELVGPWADAAAVREALLDAGQEFGLSVSGSRASTAATLESGWIPAPIPAIFSGEGLKAYREWLPATSFEASGSVGGSFSSDDVSDYYMRPADLGYAKLVKFDHDFVGRAALEAAAGAPQRRKVTLAWNKDDVLSVIATLFDRGVPAKYLDLPFVSYATWVNDEVRSGDRLVGASTVASYTYNERALLSLAAVDETVPLGSEVVVVWGEENGGSGKPLVERHVQTPIRATVSQVPFSAVTKL